MIDTPRQTKQWITSFIEEFINIDPDNTLQLETGEKAWEKPLVGFASGADDYFPFFKKDIGEFFWLPKEALQKGYSEIDFEPSKLTVISWAIPHTKQIKMEHRKATQIPSERWSRARLYGEAFNNKLRQRVVDVLTHKGYHAVSPMLLPSFRREDSAKYGYASSWSERHVAFVCGLGTFGLSDGLITPVGKAVRFGSVIADIEVEPSQRPYNDPHHYCLFFRDNSCTKCADRCPVNAISDDGHDKAKCKNFIREKLTPAIKSNYKIEIHACGLCQTKVPCESKIPKPSQV
jgi:epoxyqueuosine reductase